MLTWPLAFLIIAVLAAMLGFSGIAGAATWVAYGIVAVSLGAFLAVLAFGRKGS